MKSSPSFLGALGVLGGSFKKINIHLSNRTSIFLCQIVLIAVLAVACHSTKNTSNVSQSTPSAVSLSNTKSSADCIQNYNPQTNYFFEKVSINHAQGFVVEYHNNYKVVTVKNPWQNAKTKFQYILVQCGTPVPDKFKKMQVIQVPVNKVVSLSTTHLPHLDKLGLVDKLVAVSNTKQVNTSSVVEKIKAGKVAEVGNGASVNVERILELQPELVTTFGTGNSQTDNYPKLLEAGLKVAINAEYMETSPLGRAEWLKFTALFFNQEAKAEKVFEDIVKKYQAVASKAKAVKNHPTVFTGFNFKGTWYTPTGNSYVAKYLAEAGAKYLWDNYQSSASLTLSFETVFEHAATADYWVNVSQNWQSLQQLVTEDKRYADFKAVKTSQVFNNNARVNEAGGNDYWESGISNPDLVLSDLIKIFHPELLPEHKFVYYHQLN
ncbi:MAG: ABC transporter substrate-binding protein [Rhizonema sp. PD38]|nr:ABC transporter substrate-binding protein [Rhizonema sp. PD38]